MTKIRVNLCPKREEIMLVSQFIRKIRSQNKIPKTKLYEGLMAKKTYEKFENHNDETKLRISQLPIIAERLNLSTRELIHYGMDSFKSNYEEIYDCFTPLFHSYVNAQDKLKKDQLTEEIINLYNYSCSHKHDNICVYALYILIKSSMNAYSDLITVPDTTDLVDIKHLFKNKQFFSIYDYKMFGNLCIYFNYNDLESLINKLFPVPQSASAALIEAAFTSLENLILSEIQYSDMKNPIEILNLIQAELIVHPSYKHRLIYLQFSDLIKYLETLEPKYLFSTWNYIEIMAQADPQIVLENQKDALNQIIKTQTGTTPNITGLLEIQENFSNSLDNTTDPITHFKINES